MNGQKFFAILAPDGSASSSAEGILLMAPQAAPQKGERVRLWFISAMDNALSPPQMSRRGSGGEDAIQHC